MKKVIVAVVGAMVLTAVGVARAEEGAWQYKVTPYLWAMGMKGDVSVGRVTAPVDVKFTDAVSDLDFGGMVVGEINNGTWGFLLDGAYLKLSDTPSTPVGSLNAKMSQWIINGGAVYRVVKAPKTSVDFGAGGRLMGMDVDLDPSNTPDQLSETTEWVDPILLARVRQQFCGKAFGVLAGDIGGFGMSSDLTWQLTAVAGYSFNDNVAGMFGYRYLDYDYTDDGFTYNVASDGLMLGVQIAW